MAISLLTDNLFLVAVLMMVTGVLVNGPYALITTAVSANLVSPFYNFSFKNFIAFCSCAKISCVDIRRGHIHVFKEIQKPWPQSQLSSMEQDLWVRNYMLQRYYIKRFSPFALLKVNPKFSLASES